jgi:gamma-glutamylcyclotransferase (GGCT)/AIG2-like uncharacterized protein YtfP
MTDADYDFYRDEIDRYTRLVNKGSDVNATCLLSLAETMLEKLDELQDCQCEYHCEWCKHA